MSIVVEVSHIPGLGMLGHLAHSGEGRKMVRV